MNSLNLKYLLQFVGLTLLQLLILNHVHIQGFFSPFLYIAIVLFLPFDFPKWAIMVTGFLSGLAIDIFTYTPGVHATATTLLAFGRIQLLPLLSPRGEYDPTSSPNAFQYGWGWFLQYTLTLTALHHITLYFVESFTFAHAYFTFLKSLSSVAITVFLLILTQISGKRR